MDQAHKIKHKINVLSEKYNLAKFCYFVYCLYVYGITFEHIWTKSIKYGTESSFQNNIYSMVAKKM